MEPLKPVRATREHHTASLIIDRRRHTRHPGTGIVRLFVGGLEPTEVLARLFDYSASGFRAGHECTSLSAGQEVGFFHSKAQGRARVVWNRILSDGVESGFIILE